MKNVILKSEEYKNYGRFSHVYFVDVNYDFNEKSVDEIIDFIESDPFSPVMIHANDITVGIIQVLKNIKSFRDIWFKTDKFLFEDLAYLEDENYVIMGLDKIDYMIDSTDEVIDFKRSIVYNELVRYVHTKCPF